MVSNTAPTMTTSPPASTALNADTGLVETAGTSPERSAASEVCPAPSADSSTSSPLRWYSPPSAAVSSAALETPSTENPRLTG
jgi:hypothetical protein